MYAYTKFAVLVNPRPPPVAVLTLAAAVATDCPFTIDAGKSCELRVGVIGGWRNSVAHIYFRYKVLM